MKTRLPFSTISFNTPEYLTQKLNELRNAKILSEWFFITHKAEADEAGARDHNHVYFIPSKGIQTDDVRQELKEFDPQNPEKPRGCLTMRSSKFGNWYLYALHDPDYLASKGESRKFHYKREDFKASDQDVLDELIYEIDVVGELGAFKGMSDAKKRGMTFQEYFNLGRVAPQQVRAYQAAWEMIESGLTDRGNHLAHAIQTDDGDWINPTTGEIIPPERFYSRSAESTESPQKRPTSSDKPDPWVAVPLNPQTAKFGRIPPRKEDPDHALDSDTSR